MDVWREYQSGVALGYLPKETWETLPHVELTETEQQIAQQLKNILGAGESACIAVIKSRGGLFVTDDQKARQVASGVGVRVTGSLGILVVAIERKIISIGEAELVLAKMIDYGYWSPVENLKSLFS
jgi:predicted nucleic acid-binding protein